MDFQNYAIENKKNIINDLIELLKIDTVLVEQPHIKEAPFGQNLVDALNYVLTLGKNMGFQTKNIDNVCGYIEYGQGEEVIAVLAHLDVVPAGDGWSNPPFSPTIIDNKIYARGALDDKGSVITSLYALKALKDNNIILKKRVRLIVGTDEETASRGLQRYLEVEGMPDLGFSPDADFPIIYGEKGIMSIDLISDYSDPTIKYIKSGERYNVVPDKAIAKLNVDLKEQFLKFQNTRNVQGQYDDDQLIIKGKGAHAMQPEKGINAGVVLFNFLKDYTTNPLIKFVDKYLQDSRLRNMDANFCDSEMGDLTMNLGIFEFNDKKGKVGMNFRYPINWDKEGFLTKLKNLACKENIKVELLGDSIPHYVSKDDDLVKVLHKAYIKYTNDTSSPLITIGGGTYARHLKKAVAFGPMFPGREDVVHQVDEYAYIDDLLLSMAIYAEAIKNLGE